MSSTTNPNTCAKCRSPLTATYYYARGGAETHVDFWCPLCDPTPTNTADPVAALTADRDALRALLRELAGICPGTSLQARIDAALREGG